MNELRLRSLNPLLCATVLAALSLAPVPAEACGGLFCSAANPVNQAAERIIFARDNKGGVTQIVEIMYEGNAEKFAWVLPVPGKPIPGVSSVQALDRLQGATNPTYSVRSTVDGKCKNFDVGSALDIRGDGDGDADDGVTVIDTGTVGPFNYETITVNPDDEDPAAAAVEWLAAHDYDLGKLDAEVLRPYLENGLNLIAFKLVKGKSAGSIRPITIRFKFSVDPPSPHSGGRSGGHAHFGLGAGR